MELITTWWCKRFDKVVWDAKTIVNDSAVTLDSAI